MDDQKSESFAAWATLAADEGQDAAAFELAQTLVFNNMYNEGLIDVVEQDIGIPNLPENCGEDDQTILADAEALEDSLEREASLCAWLDG